MGRLSVWVAPGLAAGSVLVLAGAAVSEGAGRLLLVLVGAAVGFVATMVTAARDAAKKTQLGELEEELKNADERVIIARARLRVAITASFFPLTTAMGRAVACQDPGHRSAAGNQAISVALAAAKDLLGPRDVRACWFRLDANGLSGSEPAPVVLRPELHVGRGPEPRTVFSSATESGKRVLKMILTNDWQCCSDIQTEPSFSHDRDRPPTYRAFVSAAVNADKLPLGMLTVDSPTPNSFTEEDALALRVIGTVLGAALYAAGYRPVETSAHAEVTEK